MKMRNVLVLALVVLLAPSCGKNDDDAAPKERTCQLTKNSLDQTDIEYQYNAAGKVSRSKSIHPTPSDNTYSDFFYDATGTLTEVRLFNTNNVQLSREIFSFNQDNLVDTIYYPKGAAGPTKTDHFRLFEYSSGKQLLKVSFFSGQQTSGPRYYSDYSYPALDQVIEKGYGKDASGNYQLEVTTHRYFDNKLNPFAEIGLIYPELKISPHNVIATQVTYHPTGPSFSQNITYSYNAEGYPVNYTSSSLDSTAVTGTYEYNCK